MEFEIEELVVEAWLIEEGVTVCNRAPRWCVDRDGGEHTGAWNAEHRNDRLQLT